MKLSVGEIVLSLDESTLRYQIEAAAVSYTHLLEDDLHRAGHLPTCGNDALLPQVGR